MRNRLKLHNQRGIPAMAGLLLSALCCIPLQGCLFPQDEQVPGELPPKRNSTLRIVDTKPDNGPRVSVYNSTACTQPEFRLTVIDEDLADQMSSLWFIGGVTNQPFPTTPLPGGTLSREVTAPTSLGFRSALLNLETGTEILTVYVGDTAWQEWVGGEPQPIPREEKLLPDGSSVADVGSLDTFTWTLDVGPCP